MMRPLCHKVSAQLSTTSSSAIYSAAARRGLAVLIQFKFLKPPSAPNRVGAGWVVILRLIVESVRGRCCGYCTNVLFMALDEGGPLCGISFVLPI